VKIKETTPLPAWIVYAVENDILDWSDVREILTSASHRDSCTYPWRRTIAISLVLALLCWAATRF